MLLKFVFSGPDAASPDHPAQVIRQFFARLTTRTIDTIFCGCFANDPQRPIYSAYDEGSQYVTTAYLIGGALRTLPRIGDHVTINGKTARVTRADKWDARLQVDDGPAWYSIYEIDFNPCRDTPQNPHFSTSYDEGTDTVLIEINHPGPLSGFINPDSGAHIHRTPNGETVLTLLADFYSLANTFLPALDAASAAGNHIAHALSEDIRENWSGCLPEPEEGNYDESGDETPATTPHPDYSARYDEDSDTVFFTVKYPGPLSNVFLSQYNAEREQDGVFIFSLNFYTIEETLLPALDYSARPTTDNNEDAATLAAYIRQQWESEINAAAKENEKDSDPYRR